MKLIKQISVSVLLLFSFLNFAQGPPDAPLAPQDWVDKMGVGHWWIFQIPPAPNSGITTPYDPAILDSLQTKFCINGGRLHWVIESPSYSSYNGNGELPQQYIDAVGTMIDDFMARDMAICLNIQFFDPNLIKQPGAMTEARKNQMKNAWARISESFKNKSHNLAMCPVIEFHGWESLGNPARQDSLNVLYHDLTTIFRQHNPTRIMSYKPWGSAKRGEAHTLDFPFGNDPAPQSGTPFYYVASFSGAAGLGDWDTWYPGMPQADLDALHFQTMNGGSSNPNNVWGMNAMIQFRNNTGIPFWCDHWRPNYHKNYGTPEQWTMEQNLAYVEFFENKLIEIGSAGAGFQTRTFWDENTNDLIRQTATSTDLEIMSVQFMDLLETMCDNSNLSINDAEYLQKQIKLFPNPSSDFILIEKENVTKEKIKVYNYLGQEFTAAVSIKTVSPNQLKINIKELSNGIYYLSLGNTSIKFIKK